VDGPAYVDHRQGLVIKKESGNGDNSTEDESANRPRRKGKEQRVMVAFARVRQDVAEAEIAALMRDAQNHQRDARYPELFRAPRKQRALNKAAGRIKQVPHGTAAPEFRRERFQEGASGLIVTALRQGNLDMQQQRSLSTFRLEQCLLCGWYDPAYMLQQELVSDPAFEALADDSIHMLVGTREGAILSYFCIEPAASTAGKSIVGGSGSNGSGAGMGRGGQERAWTMADSARPLFPTERDLFGVGVFATLGRFANAPIAHVRELNYLMRNQTVSAASRVGTLAVVEVIIAIAQLLYCEPNPEHTIALVGHMDMEARRITYELDVPVLYAPYMPVVSGGPDTLWSQDIDLPGRFWPFVISIDDVFLYRDYFDWLDRLLDGPLSQVIRTLVARRREPRQHLPVAFAHPLEPLGRPDSASMGSAHRDADRKGATARCVWTPDPGLSASALTDERGR
jgi:hypothetical protein